MILRTLTYLFIVFPTLNGCGRDDEKPNKMSIQTSDLNYDLSSFSKKSASLRENEKNIEFRIKSGTSSGSWNSEDSIVKFHVGDTLHIVNDDNIAHRLHTNGAPCPHGPTMAANGGSYNCIASVVFNAVDNGNVYDHNFGPTAVFYIQVDENSNKENFNASKIWQPDNGVDR